MLRGGDREDPFVLADSGPAGSRGVLVDLREAHGDNADLVAMLIANPELITARAKAAGRPRASRGEASRTQGERAAAAVAARAATARVGAAACSTVQRNTDPSSPRTERRRRLARRRHAERHEHARGRFMRSVLEPLGGSSECRKGGHGERARLGISRPGGVESKVTRLDKFMPFVDAPMLLHRAPRLLELETVALVRAIVRMKHILPGGDIGRILELAPELPLAPATRRSPARWRASPPSSPRRETARPRRAATSTKPPRSSCATEARRLCSRAGRRRRPWSCR